MRATRKNYTDNMDEKRVCEISGETFIITKDEVDFCRSMNVPLATVSPVERQKHRIQFRNFRSLYNATSDKSGKPIISMYKPGNPFTVYTRDEWWEDDWDPLSFGISYDPKQSFFDQYKELNTAVPKIALFQVQCENSEYTNFAFKSANCYMVFGCVENEDCLYGHIVWQSKDVMEGLYVYRSEQCYEVVDCVGCYFVLYSAECINSSHVYFSFDLRGCNNCFGCSGLRNKEWYWNNEFIGKNEFEKRLALVFPLDHQKIEAFTAQREERKRAHVYPEYFGINNENVSGNHIYFSKNTLESFDAKECEDCKHIYTGQYFKDVLDTSFSAGYCERCYNCLTVQGSQELLCCHLIQDSYDVAYSENCYNCKHCFGCVGLRSKEYCILNMQYSKEEYYELRDQIIESMRESREYGQFFPTDICPFTYEESIVNEYHPIQSPTDEQVSNAGNSKTTQRCACGKSYKVLDIEKELYDKFQVPVPLLCPGCRHRNRMETRGRRLLYGRKCNACNKEIVTNYSEADVPNVRCLHCYEKELY